MQYIASKNYIHGCLCTDGVLLCEGNLWKISRFRFVHRANEDFESENIFAGGIAPVFFGESSEKSDVWNFGVVMKELLYDGDRKHLGERCICIIFI